MLGVAIFPLITVCTLLFGIVLTVPPPGGLSSSRQDDADCVFDSLTSPHCWGNGFSLATNWYDESPETGVVREYWLEVTNVTAAPDGYERVVLAINGTVPGPTIFADWGDTVGKGKSRLRSCVYTSQVPCYV